MQRGRRNRKITMQSVTKNMHIRKLEPSDLEQYNDLLRYAFQVTEKTLLECGWEDDDIRQSKFPVLERANVLGWFDGGRLVSQIAVYPMRMNIHGSARDMGFITSVATYPEYTGMGLMSSLMKRCLDEMCGLGQSISLLYPYSIPLYRHKGWELVSDKMAFRVKDHQLPRKLSVPGYVRRVAHNSIDLIRLHGRFARKTHGCIFRNDLAWDEYWRWDVDDTMVAIYYTSDGEPSGYMVYLIKDEIMHVKEMVYMDIEAWKGLWKYIGAHESMIYEVSGSNYSNEPIAFWLEDSDIKETVRPYIMGRIVDAQQFLAHYNFTKGCEGAEFTFIVDDPMLDINSRPFTLKLDGRGRAELHGHVSQAKASLSIGTLTSMLLGYKRPSYLRSMERLSADDETIKLLESAIPNDKAYISDYI